MSKKLKVCRRCMERLSTSEDASQDLGSYLVATGAGGVEMVEDEELCQLKMACGSKARQEKAARSLADVSEVEIDSAIANLLKQLDLHSYSQAGARELSTAIKNEWLKARQNKLGPG